MNRKAILAMAMLTLSIIFSSESLLAARVVRVAIHESKPISFTGEDGNVKGIYPEILEEIAHQAGWTLQWVPVSWLDGLRMVELGEVDLLGPISFTKERLKRFSFNDETLIVDWGQVYLPKNSEIKSILDLKSKKVAVQRGHIMLKTLEELLNRFDITCQIVPAEDQREVFDKLSKKKVDAAAVNRIFGILNEKEYSVERSTIIYYPMELRFAAPKQGREDLLKELDKQLKKLKQTRGSAYHAILDHHLFGDIGYKWSASLKYVTIIIGTIAGIALLLFVWVHILRLQVRSRTQEVFESEAKYRSIYENAVAGFFQSTPDGRFLSVNSAFASMLGYSSPAELISSVTDIATQLYANPDDRRLLQDLLHEHGHIENFTHMALRKDGSNKWVSSSTRAVIDNNGDIIKYEGVAIDIEKRKLAEKELENQNRIMTALLDNLQVGVFMVEAPDGKPILANKYAKELLGRGIMDTADKKTLADVYQAYKLGSEELYPENEMPIVKGLMGKTHSVDDMVIVQPGGKQVFLEVYGTPVRNKKGNIVASLASFSDITYRVKAEEERVKLESRLQQAQRMEAIGTLAGGIAHDFNNILFPIIGFAEMAKEDLPKDSPLLDNVNEIIEGAKRARELVKQILTFSRQAEHDLSPLEIQTVVKEVLKLTRSTLPSTIRIKQNINSACGYVMADATQVHQIAMNLITNAYYAMQKSGGTLEVSLEEVELGLDDLREETMVPGGYVRLTVADTGYGMDKATMDRIFEPYFTTKGIAKGTGMGLAIVHGIVKSYGGDILVKSETGKGSVFQVYLPVIKTDSEATESEVTDSVQKGNERILLVDDEDQIVRMMQLMLERLGYQVVAHTDSKRALESFRKSAGVFDLVITDMTMPDMTGLQLARHLREIKSNIPILICTGFSEQIDEKRVQALEIQGLVMKPVVKNELAKAIRAALGRD